MIAAGGEVQINGFVAASYVRDLKHFGLIRYPGMQEPRPVREWLGQRYVVPAAGLHEPWLALGYEDVIYSDNSYIRGEEPLTDGNDAFIDFEVDYPL